MGVLNIYHPDIEEYIEAKSYDKGVLTHFNMSVMVDNDFINAVKEDKEIYLHFPVYDGKYRIIKDKSKWEIKRKIKARYLWDQIMHKAYDNGEPGVLFYDNMNKDNNTYYTETITHTNPCFTGDMKLLTTEGYKTFKELNGTTANIINYKGEISEGKVWCSGVKEVIELKLSNGQAIKCTPDHRFMLNNGEECEAKNTLGKRLLRYSGKSNENTDLFVQLGFLQGDGCLGRLLSKHHKGLEVNIGYKDRDILSLFGLSQKDGNRRYYINGFNDILIKYMFDGSPLPQRVFPLTYNEWTPQEQRNFLKGCYSANGCVIQGCRVSYKTTSKTFAIQLKKALEKIGITANITTNKPHNVEFKNGNYQCKQSYDININKLSDIITFYQKIGFVQKYKVDNLKKLISDRSPKVVSIKPIGIAEVFDFSEPKIHWGVVEELVVHNCGEFLGGTVFGQSLQSENYGGACNLGSVFLHNMVDYPFTNHAKFNYVKLKQAIRTGVRFLDNIIDINKYPRKVYENYQKSFRTIGLGVTGLADMLAMMGLKYNTQQAQLFIYDLMNTFAFEAYKNSIELAKEKGSFPFLDKEKFVNSGYIQKHVKIHPEWKEVVNGIMQYGIRNARLISIAPTGTISLTYGNNCSSGIEPIFSLEYDRKVKIGGQTDDNIQIVKMRDYAYDLWEKTEDKTVDKDVFVTAMNMTVDDHVDMLANIAFHVDMSVSKTINVPTDYSFEDTKNIYMKCWKRGIKGCTIFRPNKLRQGILISDNNKEKEYKDSKQPQKLTDFPRGVIENVPDGLTYRKYKLKTGCGNLYLFLGLDEEEGKIYDCFTNTDGVGGCAINTQANSRLLSACMRGGVPIEYIIEQLGKSGTCPSFTYKRGKGEKLSDGKSCASAIACVLKQVLKEFSEYDLVQKDYETVTVTKDKAVETDEKENEMMYRCPECGEKTLVFEGGCNSCKNCGWSKCG